jgi:hypothetical protein
MTSRQDIQLELIPILWHLPYCPQILKLQCIVTVSIRDGFGSKAFLYFLVHFYVFIADGGHFCNLYVQILKLRRSAGLPEVVLKLGQIGDLSSSCHLQFNEVPPTQHYSFPSTMHQKLSDETIPRQVIGNETFTQGA